MNEAQAKKILAKLYGARAGWRRNEKALTGEARQRLEGELPALKRVRDEAFAARDRRRAELLQDPLYLELRSDANNAQEALDLAYTNLRSRRVTVGVRNEVGWFGYFLVKGEGDNWQEAIDAARGIKPEKEASK